MLELASLCSVYLAFGLLFASRVSRSERRRLSSRSLLDKQISRGTAPVVLVASWLLWSWAQSAAAAWLVVPVAFMLSGAIQTIGFELWPKAMKTLVFVSPAAAGILVALEVASG